MDSVGVNTPNFEAGQVSFSKKMDCENWLIAVLLEPWASSVQRAVVALHHPGGLQNSQYQPFGIPRWSDPAHAHSKSQRRG